MQPRVGVGRRESAPPIAVSLAVTKSDDCGTTCSLKKVFDINDPAFGGGVYAVPEYDSSGVTCCCGRWTEARPGTSGRGSICRGSNRNPAVTPGDRWSITPGYRI